MTKNKQKGFTIIEVALVLAVAALIFLVVFLAVPALQRNQRDDARKRDVSNAVQAVINAIANTNSQVATGVVYNGSAVGTGLGTYLDNMSSQVDVINVAVGTATSFNASQDLTAVSGTAGTVPRINQMTIYTGVKCGDNTKTVTGTARSAAVVIQLENGGNGKYYCQTAQ